MTFLSRQAGMLRHEDSRIAGTSYLQVAGQLSAQYWQLASGWVVGAKLLPACPCQRPNTHTWPVLKHHFAFSMKVWMQRGIARVQQEYSTVGNDVQRT